MPPFHGVRFYESSPSLAATVAVFLGAGLIVDEAAVIIARPEHRREIEGSLRGINFSLPALEAAGRLRVLDAGHTLRELSVNGVPDPVRFATVLDGVLGSLHTSESRVRVYDEMVDLLTQQNHKHSNDAAFRLETLWDRLTQSRTCFVLCGHGVEQKPEESTREAVCACHSHVVAPDGVQHPTARLRAALAPPSADAPPVISA